MYNHKMSNLFDEYWRASGYDHRSSRRLTLSPYRRTVEQDSLSNPLTRLPFEIQYMIYDFLIGDAKGKLCCEEVFDSNALKGVKYLCEANNLYYCHASKHLMQRKIYLKYRLPASASPQFMLTSYDLYRIVNPLYRAICHVHIEASWRDLHRLSDIVPGFAAHVLRTAHMIINDKDFEDWGSIAYFRPDVKPYPNLDNLNIIHTYRYAISKLAQTQTCAAAGCPRPVAFHEAKDGRFFAQFNQDTGCIGQIDTLFMTDSTQGG